MGTSQTTSQGLSFGEPRAADWERKLFSTPRKRKLVLALVLAASVLILYTRAAKFEFINYDDNLYVTQNDEVQQGLTVASAKWAFTTFAVANWHPLTWISHMADYQLFRLNPVGHHLVSVFLHLFNAILLFWILLRATGAMGRSLVVALLFAVHPLNVESVAWVAERKNVLCTAFMLLALAAYSWYCRQPSWKRYSSVAALFVLSLMAKPLSVTFPFMLLLWDYWPLKRFQCGREPTDRTPAEIATRPAYKLILEKIPLFILSAASSVVTMLAQRSAGATVVPWAVLPLTARLKNAAVAYVVYLGKLTWPAKLAVMYPHPGNGIAGWKVGLGTAILIAVSVIAWKLRNRRYFLAGWLWYVGTMVPMIGLVQVGDQAYADRYMYVPMIGLLVIFAWGLWDLVSAARAHRVIYAVVVLCCATALSIRCAQQLSYWQDSITLFSHVIAVTQNNFHAEVNLGGALDEAGRPEEALQHFYRAAAESPDYGLAHYDIAVHLQKKRDLPGAIQEYRRAIDDRRDHDLLAHANNNLAVCLTELGRNPEAEAHFREALKLDPSEFNAHFHFGELLMAEKKYAEAISHLEQAMRIVPTARGYSDLGEAFFKQGQLQKSVASYEMTIALQADFPRAKEKLEQVRAIYDGNQSSEKK